MDQKMAKEALKMLHSIRKDIVRMPKLMFFGTIIYDANLIVASHVGNHPINTMATDGNNIWANPEFVFENTYGENKGVLVHETIHIANCHHLRMGSRDPEEWSISCDYSINPVVLQAGLILPKDRLYDERYLNMSAEQIYALRQKEKQGQARLGISVRALVNPSGQQSPQDGQQQAQGNQGNGDQGKPQTGSSAPQKSRAGLLIKPAEHPSEQEARIRVRVIQAARLCGMSNEVLPEAIQKLVAEAKEPRSDWEERLRQFITTSCETPVDRTWSKPNRRALAMNMYLPGWRREDAGHLVIVKDTSGSIDDAPNAQFDSEIKRIIEDVKPERVTVMACDNRVRYVQEFVKGEEIELSSKGGGGTDFKPAIDRINEMHPLPQAVVYFTDMKCNSFGRPENYPVMWVQWGDYSKKPPYGEVVKVKE